MTYVGSSLVLKTYRICWVFRELILAKCSLYNVGDYRELMLRVFSLYNMGNILEFSETYVGILYNVVNILRLS